MSFPLFEINTFVMFGLFATGFFILGMFTLGYFTLRLNTKPAGFFILKLFTLEHITLGRYTLGHITIGRFALGYLILWLFTFGHFSIGLFTLLVGLFTLGHFMFRTSFKAPFFLLFQHFDDDGIIRTRSGPVSWGPSSLGSKMRWKRCFTKVFFPSEKEQGKQKVDHYQPSLLHLLYNNNNYKICFQDECDHFHWYLGWPTNMTKTHNDAWYRVGLQVYFVLLPDLTLTLNTDGTARISFCSTFVWESLDNANLSCLVPLLPP